MKKRHGKEVKANLLALGIIFTLLIILAPAVLAIPSGPSSLESVSNETGTTLGGVEFNISGGTISTFNLTASTQNPHWKAFVGNVTGQFSLDDASGSTIYDWTLSSVAGEVYASRNGSVNWAITNCATDTQVIAEDTALEHDGEDNITSTFTSGSNTKTFVVAGNTVTAGNCSATNTYVNNATQGTEFEEVILHDGISTIFATVMEPDETGFDGNTYDFQMIVPENGSDLWTGQTAYYIYVELS